MVNADRHGRRHDMLDWPKSLENGELPHEMRRCGVWTHATASQLIYATLIADPPTALASCACWSLYARLSVWRSRLSGPWPNASKSPTTSDALGSDGPPGRCTECLAERRHCVVDPQLRGGACTASPYVVRHSHLLDSLTRPPCQLRYTRVVNNVRQR
jgi:hypothetical protein